MGLLDALTDPVMMAQIEQRRQIVARVAEQMGCTPAEARVQMDHWDRVAMETFCLGNNYPREALH